MRSNPALTYIFCFLAAAAHGQTDHAAPNTVFVKTALGGIILGYDIDQSGTEGLLSEARVRADGSLDVAVETFDQITGKILKIVAQQTMTHNDAVTLGIFGNSVGLVELEESKGLFVTKRLYGTMNPVDSNQFTRSWIPPLTRNDVIIRDSAQPRIPKHGRACLP